MPHIRLHKEHPYRPVEWRWQRAVCLVEDKKRPSKKHDDNWIAEALRFQYKLDKCIGDEARYDLFDEMRDIYLAYELYGSNVDRDLGGMRGKSHPGRYEIEARLLAKQSFEDISCNLHTTPSAIEAYEALFFNVKDRINSTGYIVHSVIGPSIHRGLSDREFDTLWKLFGYFWGKEALNELISTFEYGVPKHIELNKLGQAWAEDTKRTMQRKSALSARTLSINSYTQIQVLEMHARYTEIERQGEASSNVAVDFLANINEMLANVPWGVGIEHANHIDVKVLPHYDMKSGREPRASQLFMLEDKSAVEVEVIKFPEISIEQKKILEGMSGEPGGPKPGGATEPVRATVGPPPGYE